MCLPSFGFLTNLGYFFKKISQKLMIIFLLKYIKKKSGLFHKCVFPEVIS